MNYQTSKKGQRGQALILIAFAAVGLFAFSALAIDGSRAFSNKRQAQNAADTAVLTAALKYIREEPGTGDPVADEALKWQAAEDAARARATSNGFDPANPGVKTEVQVYVQRCDELTDDQTGDPLVCDGLPTGAVESEYIRVRIVSVIPTTFGRVIGRQTLTSAAEAIARVQGSSGSSTASGFAGAAMVATNDDENGSHCFLFNGHATLHTYDSGVFVNCGDYDAMFLNGSTVWTMEADSYVVGCKDGNPGYQILGGHTVHCDQAKIPVGPTTFAHVPTMPSPPTCTGPGSYPDGNHLKPGYFPGNVTVNKDTVMDPGVYCFNGGINVNGTNALSGSGNVQMVIPNGSFTFGPERTFTFDSLEVFTVDGDIDIKGSLVTNRLRFYSSGNGSMGINSGSYVRSQDAYFYIHRGTLRWNGDTDVELTAPTTDDPAAGILIHMPWENTNDCNLNGGSHALLRGTILAPHSKGQYNGGTNFTLYGQIIAYYYGIDGGGDIEIHYVSNDLISPPVVDDPTIELTK